MDAHIKSNFRHILVVYSHLKPVNKSYAALFATETLVIWYESNMTVRWLFPLTELTMLTLLYRLYVHIYIVYDK